MESFWGLSGWKSTYIILTSATTSINIIFAEFVLDIVHSAQVRGDISIINLISSMFVLFHAVGF